jgi:methylated-DNA-[protein]-cysteine S-methyltransferase
MTTITTTVESPVGPLTLTASEGKLTSVAMRDQRHAPSPSKDWIRDDEWFTEVAAQLAAYFAGELTTFDVPMNLVGTEFQRNVWSRLTEIPYGTTISYGELARRVGNPLASSP